MKNIHVLPTDKPSRLYCYKSTYLYLHSEIIDANVSNSDCNNKNIYITSDEEIKEGDVCINLAHRLIVYPTDAEWANSNHNNLKKIILTTDQDLIKDGVQAIDDEFLEWFVKNPSCEYVEIYSLKEGNEELGYHHYKYEIIIPKEKPKQETLEEAAENFLNNSRLRNYKVLFIEGAKWQMERMYSEEDMKKAFKVGFSVGYGSDTYAIDERNKTCEEWFEWFKK